MLTLSLLVLFLSLPLLALPVARANLEDSLKIDNRTVIHCLAICSAHPFLPNLQMLQYSVDYVNNRTDLFPSFRIQLHGWGTNGSENFGQAIKNFIDGFFGRDNIVLLLGSTHPSESEALARVGRFYHLPQMGFLDFTPTLSNKVLYPYYFRMSVTDEVYVRPVLGVLEKFGWNQIGILTIDYSSIYALSVEVEQKLKANNVSIVGKAIYHDDPTDSLNSLLKLDIRVFVVFRAIVYEKFSSRLDCLIANASAYGQKYTWIQLGYVFTQFDVPNSCPRGQRAAAMEGSIEFDNIVDETKAPHPRCILNVSGEEIFAGFNEQFPDARGQMYGLSSLSIHLDSVLTSAMAINSTLETKAYNPVQRLNDTSFNAALIDRLREVDYYGITGRIRFNPEGDRVVRVNVYQIRNLTRQLVAQFDPSTDKITWQRDVWFPDGRPTLVQPAVEWQTAWISKPWAILIACLASLLILLTLACIGFNVKHRDDRLIRMSSPNINNLIGAGCLLSFVSCLAKTANSALPLTTGLCWLELCFICAGYSLAYGALLAKTWRVRCVFSNRQMRRVVIRDYQLVAIAFSVVLLDALLIGIWAIADPLQLRQISLPDVPNTLNTLIVKRTVQVCRSENHRVWEGCLIGVNGLLLSVGIMFAWETRNIYIEELNDSKTIGVCVYNTVVMGAAGVALLFVLPDTELDLKFGLVSMCILTCAATTVVLVFGSKIYALLRPAARVADNQSAFSIAGCINSAHSSSQQ